MPGLHKHQGASSYYLVPNFGGDCRTYQLESEGRDILLSMGFSNGETVPRNVFDALNDLGLLYFKHSDKDPQATAPSLDATDFEIAAHLSPTQRCVFITNVLETTPLSTIDSDAFYSIYFSLEEADAADVKPVLKHVLTNTPFTEENLPFAWDILWLELTFQDPSALAVAAFLHFIYAELWDNTQHYHDLVVDHGGESLLEHGQYDVYLVEDSVWSTEGKTLTVPTPLSEKLHAAAEGSGDSITVDIMQEVSELVGCEYLSHRDRPLARAAAAGVTDLEDLSLTFLPRVEPESPTEISFTRPDMEQLAEQRN